MMVGKCETVIGTLWYVVKSSLAMREVLMGSRRRCSTRRYAWTPGPTRDATPECRNHPRAGHDVGRDRPRCVPAFACRSPSEHVRSTVRNRNSHLRSLGIRLAEKRSLPCPRRNEWYAARDTLYEEIMAKGYNKEKQFFAQSYEDQDILDSSLLIMPLVFFSTPVSAPRIFIFF